jgi:hypothetical protein
MKLLAEKHGEVPFEAALARARMIYSGSTRRHLKLNLPQPLVARTLKPGMDDIKQADLLHPLHLQVYAPWGLWNALFDGNSRPFPRQGLPLKVRVTGRFTSVAKCMITMCMMPLPCPNLPAH